MFSENLGLAVSAEGHNSLIQTEKDCYASSIA